MSGASPPHGSGPPPVPSGNGPNNGGPAATQATVAPNYNAGDRGARTRHPAFGDRLLVRSDLRNLPQPEPLIADTIETRTVALLAGNRGTGKSFVALDWALSVATGRAWHGRAVPVGGPVAYVAAEGAHGLEQRVAAWERVFNHGRPVSDDVFAFYPNPVDLRTRDGASRLCDYAAGRRLLVLDTVHRCMPSADENSAKDVGEAVAALYRIRDAMTDTGGTVVGQHHTGKDGRGARGSSVFEDNVDTVYLTRTLGDGLIELTRTKRRDGPTEDRLRLQLTPTEASCTLSPPALGISGSAKRLLAHLNAHFGADGAQRSDLRKSARDGDLKMSDTTFDRAVGVLLAAGLVVSEGSDTRPRLRPCTDADIDE